MKKSSNKIIYIIIIALAAVMVGVFIFITTGAYKKSPTVDVKADNCYTETLRVVTDEDYRPYSFYGDKGISTGHDVELITLVANKLKMNLDLWLVPWDEGIDAVTSGRADILMTCDYSDVFKDGSIVKSEPVSEDDFIVYSKQKISSDDELYGMKIAITENANVLSTLKMMNLDKYCVEYSSNRMAMTAVANGEADCAIMRNTVGSTLLKDKKLSGIRACISVGKSYMCFGINDSNAELADRINEAIEELKSEGVLYSLRDKWLTTFVAPYSVMEVLEKNIWIMIVFFVLVIALALVFLIGKQKTKRDEKVKALYVDVIENLTNDFESVLYVGNYDKEPDDVVELRLSESLKNNIPGWEDEKRIEKRLELMCKYIVVAEDKEMFAERTTRRVIIRKLDIGKVYFVNFYADIDGAEHYYQIKFSAGLSGNGDLNGCIVGIHNIDDELRKDIEGII